MSDDRVLDAGCSRAGQVYFGVRTMTDEIEKPAPEYIDEEDLTVRENWAIDGLPQADWALSRLRDMQTEQAELQELEDEAVLRVRLRGKALREKAARGERFFAAKLREFAEGHREELLKGGKRKTRELMNGSLGWRKKGGGLEVVDEAALLVWAQKQPMETGFLRIKEEPAWSEIKKAFAASGEIPDGCGVQPEFEEFVVKTTGDKHGRTD